MYTVLPRRARAELSAAYRELAGMNRWRLVRWLGLPVVFLWTLTKDVLTHPWHAAPVLLVAAALLARYRWPSAALVGAALVSAVPGVVVALPVLAYGAGRRLSSARRAVPTIVSAILAAGANAYLWFTDVPPWPTTAALLAGYVTTVVLLPVAVGTILGERARRIESLRERNAILERAQRLGDLRARMQERARIAGEMHDLLGHRLSLIALYAGALELRTRDQQPALNSQADLIRSTAGTALDELREVLGILRVDTGLTGDAGLTDSVGRRADIESLVDSSCAAGQPVTLQWHGDDLTDADVRMRRAVHRVVREALTNVHKHAPQAPTRVHVRVEAVRAVIEIRNPLRLPQPSSRGTGLGLVGLQERARLIGGTVTAHRDAAEFVLVASLPLAVPEALSASRSADADPHIVQELLLDGQAPAGAPVADACDSGEASSPRSFDTMSKSAKIILACLTGAVLVVCGGGGFAVYRLAKETEQVTISAAEFAAVQPGQTRTQVRDKIGDVGTAAKAVIDAGREPPVPAGATCDYAVSEDAADDVPRYVYRFCYVNDVLVEKKEIPTGNGSTTK